MTVQIPEGTHTFLAPLCSRGSQGSLGAAPAIFPFISICRHSSTFKTLLRTETELYVFSRTGLFVDGDEVHAGYLGHGPLSLRTLGVRLWFLSDGPSLPLRLAAFHLSSSQEHILWPPVPTPPSRAIPLPRLRQIETEKVDSLTLFS